MLKVNPKVIGCAFLAVAATVLSIDLKPAQALTLNGSLAIGGNGTIDETFDSVAPGTNGDKTKLSFLNPSFVVSVAGDFAVPNITPALLGSSPTIKNLILTDPDGDFLYDNPGVTSFIDFGNYTIISGSNTVTGNLSFDLFGGNNQFKRSILLPSDISYQDPNGIFGKFKFNGGTFGTGFVNISQSSQSGSFQISLTATGIGDPPILPEPSAAIALGIAFGLVALKKNGKKASVSKNA